MTEHITPPDPRLQEARAACEALFAADELPNPTPEDQPHAYLRLVGKLVQDNLEPAYDTTEDPGNVALRELLAATPAFFYCTMMSHGHNLPADEYGETIDWLLYYSGLIRFVGKYVKDLSVQALTDELVSMGQSHVPPSVVPENGFEKLIAGVVAGARNEVVFEQLLERLPRHHRYYRATADQDWNGFDFIIDPINGEAPLFVNVTTNLSKRLEALPRITLYGIPTIITDDPTPIVHLGPLVPHTELHDSFTVEDPKGAHSQHLWHILLAAEEIIRERNTNSPSQ